MHSTDLRAQLRYTASLLLDRGYLILPLWGKKPLINGWTDASVTFSLSDLESAFERGADGIGLRMDDHIDIDVDATDCDPQQLSDAVEILLAQKCQGEVFDTLRFRSSRGIHTLYGATDYSRERLGSKPKKFSVPDVPGGFVEVHRTRKHQCAIPPTAGRAWLAGSLLERPATPIPDSLVDALADLLGISRTHYRKEQKDIVSELIYRHEDIASELTLHDYDYEAIAESAARRRAPNGRGQHDKAVMAFASDLKSKAAFRFANRNRIVAAHSIFYARCAPHVRATEQQSLEKFLRAWQIAEQYDAVKLCRGILDQYTDEELPEVPELLPGRRRRTPKNRHLALRRTLAICHGLAARRLDGRFFLACRTLAKVFGTSVDAAARYLEDLRACELIVLEVPGCRRRCQASTYSCVNAPP